MHNLNSQVANGAQSPKSALRALTILGALGLALTATVTLAAQNEQTTTSSNNWAATSNLPKIKPDFQLHSVRSPELLGIDTKAPSPGPTKKASVAPKADQEDLDSRNQLLARRNTQEPRLLVGALWSIFRPMWGAEQDTLRR